MKKTLCVLLSVLFAALSFPLCASAEPVSPRLYNTYGDAMLFQHSEEATLAGTAEAGSLISCKLKNSAGETVASAKGDAEADNTFKISFDAPEGGYEEYTIELYCGGTLFRTLTEVVFGELWLAGGQSNMHIFLRYTKTGTEMVKNGETGSENIRILDMPLVPGFSTDPGYVALPGGTGADSPTPLMPQKDIEGARWFKGDSEEIYDITGVGYFFAEKLQKDIDMPVGILCDYLGGSKLCAWLSREAIESDKQVKADLGSDYIPAKKWDETKDYNNLSTMSGLYNKKTAPLTNFRIAGMIWYQGESDCSSDYGVYSRGLALLQDMLTKDFGYRGGRLPIVFTTFADYNFGLNNFRLLGAELGEFAKEDFSSRAVVTISDLPLGYTESTQAVHPYDKKPVGERMALAAEGLVYGKYSHSCCSPVLDGCEASDGSLYLTFTGVCDGLVCSGDTVHGFTVCGRNGVYVPAKAEIVSADTVRVYNENIKNPVAAMYSQGLITCRSNLYSSVDGELFMPVCHAVSNRDFVDCIWQDCGWTDCDCEQIWHQQTIEFADFLDVWSGENCGFTVSEDAAFCGDAGLKIEGCGSFSVSPNTCCYDEYAGETQMLSNWDGNWKNFTSLSVMLKNDGENDITFDGVKLSLLNGKCLTPTVKDTKDVFCTVPADGQWHRYEFDLDNLYTDGRKSFFTLTRLSLKDVTGVDFCFSSGETTDLCFDDIQLTPYEYPVSLFRFSFFDLITFFHRFFNLGVSSVIC